jgi:hypothetical protein
VILDGATVVGTATARAGVDVTSATPRPGVPRRSDVYTGKFEGRATAVGRRIPPGYRAVWDDGRLNPHRGPRTAAGDAQMRRLWTDTVPMEGVGPGG